MSDYECFIDLCDKEELHDSAMIIPMSQLVKESDSFVFDRNTYAENKKIAYLCSSYPPFLRPFLLGLLGYIACQLLMLFFLQSEKPL